MQKINSATMGSDWSLLPPELLQAISKKVEFMGDYIRFRTVCHPWRSASSPWPHHLPVQAPWLMLPYQFKGNDDSTRLFYDLSTSKINQLDLPETRGVEVCGSAHGWLVLCDGKVTSLLNPITRTTITLPSYTGPLSPLGIAPLDASDPDNFFENWDPDKYTNNPTDNFNVKKAILTSSPLNPNCLVFVFTSGSWCSAFCKIGDDKWTVIEFYYHLPWEYSDILDFTYSNGFLNTINPFAHFTIYNLNNPSRKEMLGPGIGLGSYCSAYLVEGVSGDILLIEHNGQKYEDGVLVKEIEHMVYKLSNNEEPEWIEVNNLGQNVLFVDGDDHAISLSSANQQLPKWGAKCLFYDSIRVVEWYSSAHCRATSYNHNIKLDRLDDGTLTEITGDLGLFQMTWLWQKSLWWTPSFL